MRCYCVLVFLFYSFSSYAIDIVNYNKAHSEMDQRDNYPLQVLTLALEKTKGKYGDYKIEFSPILFKRNRALRELQSGNKLNVYSAPSRKQWEDAIAPIYFPIFKGLLNYRRLLINKQDAEKFENITNIKQLKKLKSGLGRQWSTTEVLNYNEFNLVTSSSYEGLFGMLNLHRFDYYIRGINEIYDELEARTHKYPNMIIEDSIVLNIPLPIFFFVSLKHPKLHKRIQEGLWIIHRDGSFERLFNQFHATFIVQTAIAHKKVFYINNEFINDHEIYSDETLWIDPKNY